MPAGGAEGAGVGTAGAGRSSWRTIYTASFAILLGFRLLLTAVAAAPAGSMGNSSLTASETEAARIAGLPSIFRPGTRILFQGEVTIDGARWHHLDYKVPIWQDYAFMIAADYGVGYPEKHLVFINRTMQGDTIGTLADRWQQDALALKPDVISILIGVNDLVAKFPHDQTQAIRKFAERYDELLAGTFKANPQIKLLLCTPFVLPGKYTTPRWSDWVELIGQMETAVDELGRKYHVPVVHFQKFFNAAPPQAAAQGKVAEVSQPTYAEHRQMAAEWIRAYQAVYGPSAINTVKP